MDTGTIGEYYTLCELWRNGINAISSDSPVQKGWDILILDSASENILYKLQVKCINWKVKDGTARTTGVDISKDFDYLVVVILNKEEKYQLFVIPRESLRYKEKDERDLLFDNEGKLLCSKKNLSIETLKREDRWNLFFKYKDAWPLY